MWGKTMATMTMARKLPDIETLKGHVAAGLTNRQIATLYGVTPEAVRLALQKEGILNGPGRNDHSKYVPWRIKASHARHSLLNYLRLASRREQRIPLSSAEDRRLDAWMAYMDGGNPFGVPLSVHYGQDDEDGFWLAPRQAGDRNYISPPRD